LGSISTAARATSNAGDGAKARCKLSTVKLPGTEVPMKCTRFFVFACVVSFGTAPVMAQEPTRLQIQVTRDGSVVARPELRVESGREGRLELSDEFLPTPKPSWVVGLRERVAITPTVRGDDLAIAFNIASGDDQFQPSMVISKDVRGSVEWTAADGKPIRLTVSWVQ
jgi:hypothetical protein